MREDKMAIVIKAYMVLEERVECPVVLCDVCLQPIVDSQKAMYLWKSQLTSAGRGSRLYFIHNKCEEWFKTKHREEEFSAMELRAFPVVVGNNLNTDWVKCEEDEMFQPPGDEPEKAFADPIIPK